MILRQTPGDKCKCGHIRDEHTHYRNGSDCGSCPGCPHFRRAGWLFRMLHTTNREP